jgi:predicted nucleic acid-binding protein
MCVVLDSMVWFSLACGDLHLRILELGSVVCSVDRVVEDELIAGPNGAELVANGLSVEEVSGAGVAQAVAWRERYPALSAADVLSLALALERGWHLATQDGDLRTLAEEVGVPLLCVVDVLAMMAQAGLLVDADIARFKYGMYTSERPYDKSKLRQVEKVMKSTAPDTS